MEMQPTFKSRERQGWSERTVCHDDSTARIHQYRRGAASRGSKLAPGKQVLDVCWAPGSPSWH
jgi:hypothetical protein